MRGAVAHADHLATRLAYEERLKALLDIAVDGVYIHDLDGVIVEFNQSFADMLGYGGDEIRRLNVADIETVRAASELQAAFRAAAETRKAFQIETRHRRKDGSLLDVEVSLKAVTLDGETYLYCASRDIGERLRLRRSLEEERNRLSDFASCAGDSFTEVDKDLRFIYVWEGADEASRALARARLGVSLPDAVAHDTLNPAEHTAQHLDMLRAHKPFRDFQYAVAGRGGDVMWLSINGVPVFDAEGDFAGYRFVSVDITARKRAELALEQAKTEAEAANKAKSEFLANVSHELRTPLNAIAGMTQLLSHSPLNEQQKGYLQKLDRAGQTMLVLIGDILDLARIEARQLEFNEAPFALADAVAAATDAFAVSAANKGLALRVEPLPDALPPLIGDALRIGQILGNLVGNAIKFTARGDVTISVKTLERSADSVRLRVAVRDTGVGVAREHRARLFEPFVQAEGKTSGQFGGVGLGLAICKRLVELMGGEIGVESEPGEGSEFWFCVGLRIERSSTASEPRAPEADDGALAGARLLVVDDSETNREIAIALLSRAGAVCSGVGNGREAVERLRAGPRDFDLVLMDVQMPEMDGLEATRAIRQDLGATSLPVIALTAGALPGQRQLALAAGMNGFVAKPFRLPALIAALSPWVGKGASGAVERGRPAESAEP